MAGSRPGWSFSLFLAKNSRRIPVLAGVAGLVLFLFGPRQVVESVSAFIAAAPMLGIQLAFAMVFMIAQFAALMYFLSRPRKYVMLPGDDQMGLAFADYRGQPDLLEHARSTVRILRGIQSFELSGGEIPKGMLLSGGPGTGKTFLASVIASEAQLPFIYLDASSLSSMWMGGTQLMIGRLFAQARNLSRKYAPPGRRGACIVFLDEIDSIGAARGASTSGMPMMGGMMMGGGNGLNTLLNCMDSTANLMEDRFVHRFLRWLGVTQGPVQNRPVVFVIGSTNRPEILDTALTRPGRLDRLIKVYEPDGTGRRDIIGHYLGKVKHEEIDIEMMVSDSVGWTPVAIKTTINEALIVAHDDGRETMTYRDWLAAADQRALGLKQPIANMHPDDVRALAYHEAGHAVVAYFTQPKNRLLKATIIRSGDALGAVSRSPREERYTTHGEDILSGIAVSLGSRAVEETVLGTSLTGASSDLQSATNAALAYCARYGMGPTYLVADPKSVQAAADALLDDVMAQTKSIIARRRDALDRVAAALIDSHELIGDELAEVIGPPDSFDVIRRPDLPKPFGAKDEPDGV